MENDKVGILPTKSIVIENTLSVKNNENRELYPKLSIFHISFVVWFYPAPPFLAAT
jgi:hypothetical protein|tara:strand:- start:6337 stop:6504 length:168 start_codon:yes stop_codon:yes gene_type:complete